MSTEERRALGATRIPFDALVEVGGALGPTFEAQAVNVSGDGIQLRTAYLPEPGQPLTCRFDAGPDQSVLAAGEVVWAQGADRGGEFGVRFTDVDAESVEALKRVCGLMASMPAPEVHAGSKVRLHIDGLAAPMRAKIKDAHRAAVTVGSDLGFLQVGRQVELEDAEHGGKRPANIDRVDIALDPTSHVPQLVVTLRYSDVDVDVDMGEAEGRPAEAHAQKARVETAAPSPSRVDDLEAMEQASAQMKGFFARNVSRIAPKMKELAERARETVAILGKKQSERLHEGASPRRTTAPAPSGLHASPRRVLRGQSSAASIEAPVPPMAFAVTKRRAAVAGGVMIAAILGALALKKVHHEAPHDATLAAASASAAAASPASTGAAEAAPVAPAQPAAQSVAPPPAPAAPVAENEDTEGAPAHKKHVHVAPFANGPVHHGNILRLKMDGVIESLEGAQQPTGFTVKVPGHKSLEAAAPLASRDSRIQAIKVSNDSAGAELTVAFKDGVPNYRVTAKGDTLVIALAPPEATTDAVAKKDETGASRAKHKHTHDAHEKKKSEEEL
ncbi:MAG TPA: PilZ domain-containing protein [Polyangiaceae bacterium]|nr:PilZ domain-containing protein [Polyangiaceae bacterium]